MFSCFYFLSFNVMFVVLHIVTLQALFSSVMFAAVFWFNKNGMSD